MNIQTKNSEAQCCVDYCETTFEGSGQQVVNSYKCNQKHFSASDMWNIQRNKRDYQKISYINKWTG